MSAIRSVQLYSVRDSIDADLAGTVARLADIGFINVEPYGFHTRPDEFAAAFSAAGVSAPSGHAPAIDSDDAEQIFEAARTLGIGTVIDPFIPRERWQQASDVAATAERVNDLAELARSYGLRFGYHNHNHEIDTEIEGGTAFDYFVARLAPEVVLEVDTYWATVGGADVPALLRSLGDRVRFIHVKDGTRDGDIQKQQPAGEGEIDIPPILAAAPDAARVVEFDIYNGDVFAAIAQSYAWLEENDK